MKTSALLVSGLAALALAPISPLAQASVTPEPPDTTAPTETTAPEDTTAPGQSPEESPGETTSPEATPTGEESPGATPTGAAAPFGPGCASLPASGPGSLQSAAGKPVAAAVADNPKLSTLSKAIKAADLTQRLDSAKDITVFAPTDDAFSEISKDELDKLLANKQQLRRILSYHVVEGKKTKADLSNATLTTMEGGQLTVKGSGNDYTVNDDAKIECGGIPTKNATVYLIDKVLMPR
ncbi:hypothetical protein Misp01_61650 [Microtetraspora sp. NBRC 13810]|uniref:fasciclin domain-containing protein n=1 Tax=Microtetraspora sp. NBRC 13810 TaxID=3030990 RepID=UPI0024A1114F|nr:fasciclin domain-containing protein [Microtetraspora sp. NBRC 13810]GLW11037.1 hypothetical protein Misp01_61650 [Microtetraspora sp. NBRC 13810]